MPYIILFLYKLPFNIAILKDSQNKRFLFYSFLFFSGPSDSDNFSHNLRGIIPRSFEYLFSLIDREKEKVKLTVKTKCWCAGEMAQL
jgi:hypothetical protein